MPDPERYLRWLQHGADLALREKGEVASHRDAVWKLIEDAVYAINKLPDQDRRWLSSGTRSGGWSQIGFEFFEARDIERSRVLSGMHLGEAMTYTPQSVDVDRAMDVFDWITKARRKRNGDRLVKAAILLAAKGDVQEVYKIFSPGTSNPDRRVAYRIRQTLTSIIINDLKKIGIMPVGTVHFQGDPW